MRSIETLKSSVAGIAGMFITYILRFVSRTVFINTLGIEYMGVSSLFTNVLSILSLTELGFGSAMAFALYKPLAQKDEEHISALMVFYKKAYFVIGAVFLGFGITLIPFLPVLIKTQTKLVNINVIYILYLLQNVSSYWFLAYKGTILKSDQKRYLVTVYTEISQVCSLLVQIGVLYVLRSFIAYVIIGIIANIACNAVVAWRVDKEYPYLKQKPTGSISKEEKKSLFKNVYSLFLYKVCSTVNHSADNLVISAMISVASVGVYSNYTTVTGMVKKLMQYLFGSSMIAGIGNLYASSTREHSEEVFWSLNFANFWIYGYCSIMLFVLLNPFVFIWLKGKYMLDMFTVFIICLSLAVEGLMNAPGTFREACGLFWYARYRPFFSVVINVVMSVVLAKPMGIAGVLLATIISRVTTTGWYDAMIVFRHAFEKKATKYYFRYVMYLAVILSVGAVTYFAVNLLTIDGLAGLILKFIVGSAFVNGVFWLFFHKWNEYTYLKSMAVSIVKRLTRKRKKN